MNLTCENCNRTFSKKSNLNRHSQNVHGLKPESRFYDDQRWSYKCLELNCCRFYKTSNDLIDHLKDAHGILFEEPKEFTFSNKNDFECWKSDYEEINKCNYVIARVNKISKSGHTLIYYNCHRSRTGKQYITDRIRQIKSQGHCKMVNSCTSQIRLKIHGDELSVRLQETHYGHNQDVQHLRISNKVTKNRSKKRWRYTECSQCKPMDNAISQLNRSSLLTSLAMAEVVVDRVELPPVDAQNVNEAERIIMSITPSDLTFVDAFTYCSGKTKWWQFSFAGNRINKPREEKLEYYKMLFQERMAKFGWVISFGVLHLGYVSSRYQLMVEEVPETEIHNVPAV